MSRSSKQTMSKYAFVSSALESFCRPGSTRIVNPLPRGRRLKPRLRSSACEKKSPFVAGNSKNRAFAYICIDFSFKRLLDPSK